MARPELQETVVFRAATQALVNPRVSYSMPRPENLCADALPMVNAIMNFFTDRGSILTRLCRTICGITKSKVDGGWHSML